MGINFSCNLGKEKTDCLLPAINRTGRWKNKGYEALARESEGLSPDRLFKTAKKLKISF